MYYKFFLLLWTVWFVGAIVNIFWLKQKKNSALLIVLVKAKKNILHYRPLASRGKNKNGVHS